MRRHKIDSPIIRLATLDDLAQVNEFAERCLHQNKTKPSLPIIGFPDQDARSILHTRILKRCLLVAEIEGRLSALAGINLDRGEFSELLVPRPTQNTDPVQTLVAETERLAVQYGLCQLVVRPDVTTHRQFLALGYTPYACITEGDNSATSGLPVVLKRSLLRRQTRYARRVRSVCDELGIPSNYGQVHEMMLQTEARHLSSIGLDVFGREQQLTTFAAVAWHKMQSAAMEDGIELQTVSAWRSVSYQAGLLRRKVEKGQSMAKILEVSAAPGFSEHHTGRAIDITTPGFPPVEEQFDQSQAFLWLQSQAEDFGFRLSFPRNNRHGLAYEPWHWFFLGGKGNAAVGG